METINFRSKENPNQSEGQITVTRASNDRKWSYINFDYMNLIAPGNKKFSIDMLSLFRDNSTVYLSKIEEYTARQDFDSVARVAHAMKPTGTFVGISALNNIMAELEIKAKAHLHVDVLGLLANAQILVNAAIVEINEYLTLNS